MYKRGKFKQESLLRSLLLDMINDWNYSGWSIRTNHASKLEQCFLLVSNQFLPLSTFCIRGQMVDLSHLHSAIKSKKVQFGEVCLNQSYFWKKNQEKFQKKLYKYIWYCTIFSIFRAVCLVFTDLLWLQLKVLCCWWQVNKSRKNKVEKWKSQRRYIKSPGKVQTI